MRLSQITVFSAITARPGPVSMIFFAGYTANSGGFIDTGALPASGSWIEPTRYTGDSATIASSPTPGWRLLYEWSKLQSLTALKLRALVRLGGGTSSDVNARVYNVTTAAAITGSVATKASPAGNTDYDMTSGDFKANMTTTDNDVITIQLMATWSVQPTVTCSRIELLAYL